MSHVHDLKLEADHRELRAPTTPLDDDKQPVTGYVEVIAEVRLQLALSRCHLCLSVGPWSCHRAMRADHSKDEFQRAVRDSHLPKWSKTAFHLYFAIFVALCNSVANGYDGSLFSE